MCLVPLDVSLAAGCVAGISSVSNVLWRFPVSIETMSGTDGNRSALAGWLRGLSLLSAFLDGQGVARG